MLLQQCLPFTVLKPSRAESTKPQANFVATVLTVYGIETTFWLPYLHLIQRYGCNSAYRLRY